MIKKKILGYIVYNTFGPKMLGEANVLWFDVSVTLFKSRVKAVNAIRRTEKYAIDHGYSGDPWFNHSILPVTGEK